jgi:hypothetical protein
MPPSRRTSWAVVRQDARGSSTFRRLRARLPFRFWQCRVRRGVGCPCRAWSSARTDPLFRFRDSPFFTFVADIGPQAVQLTAGNPVIHHQDGFQLTDLRRRFPQPVENRAFLVARGAAHTADPIAFGQLGQRFDNFGCGCLASIKQRPFRRRESVAAGPTLIALLPIVSTSKLDDVSLQGGLRFPVISALGMWAEVTRLD